MPDEREATVPPDKVIVFRRALLRWYRGNRRRFPWRETDDPYLILLSEVLLQRTQASQVHDSYEAFIQAFPTLESLADSSEEAIAIVLRPLGLSKRAATLKAMGRELTTRFVSRVPVEVDDLMTLPGVGRYIATATACFAAGSRKAVLDSNVIRVVERFFGVSSEKKRPREDPELWQLATSLLPRSRVAASAYNRALLDFAALVCKPRSPACPSCPLRVSCSFNASVERRQAPAAREV